MSIVGYLALVSQEQVDALHRDPSSIFDVLNSTRAQHETRILDYARNVESIFAFHYAFSGELASEHQSTDSPLGFLMAGGWEVDDIEVGYGPARLFDSKQLGEIASALNALDRNEAKQRLLDPGAAGPQPEIHLPPGIPAVVRFTPTQKQVGIGEEQMRAMLDQIMEFLRSGSAKGLALLVYAS